MNYFKSIKERDPAYHNFLFAILFYPGIKALFIYKIAHFFYKMHFFFLAFLLTSFCKHHYQIEIHPGAKIGKNLFIDHGFGVVIGETAIIHDDVTIFHGVTLGGTGKEKTKKRHPTILSGVLIGSGAKVLGNITIGKNAKIGANAVVLKDVANCTTVVGIPGCVVEKNVNKWFIL